MEQLTLEEKEKVAGSKEEDSIVSVDLEMNQDEINQILKVQGSRPMTAYQKTKLEKEAKKNWDIFYKINGNRFFKDRHWTIREFEEISELVSDDTTTTTTEDSDTKKVLLEIGCGVGNFAFPILKEIKTLKIWACDFSSRAIDLVKSHEHYNEERIQAFVCDIIQDNCFSSQPLLLEEKVDFISLIFVLSAISPEHHMSAIKNLTNVCKSGTVICFRDYGRYDMAQLRFKAGKQIEDNFYVRRDGTRAYYFTPEEVKNLFISTGHFVEVQCDYVHRRTVNLKEQVDVQRTFVQGKWIYKE